MRTTYELPFEMVLPTGETLKPVIGCTLDGKPFEVGAVYGESYHDAIKEKARREGLKYRRIGVLSRNLRGKYDLHGSLYRPNVWSFVEVVDEEMLAADRKEAARLQAVIDASSGSSWESLSGEQQERRVNRAAEALSET